MHIPYHQFPVEEDRGSCVPLCGCPRRDFWGAWRAVRRHLGAGGIELLCLDLDGADYRGESPCGNVVITVCRETARSTLRRFAFEVDAKFPECWREVADTVQAAMRRDGA